MAELLTTFEALVSFQERTTLKEIDDSPTLLTAYELLQEEESLGSALVLVVKNEELNKVISRRIGYPIPKQLDSPTARLYGLIPAGNGYIYPKREPSLKQVWRAVQLLMLTIFRN